MYIRTLANNEYNRHCYMRISTLYNNEDTIDYNYKGKLNEISRHRHSSLRFNSKVDRVSHSIDNYSVKPKATVSGNIYHANLLRANISTRLEELKLSSLSDHVRVMEWTEL